MRAVILDACGALNLYASGRFLQVLLALECEWYLPAAVERESQQYRQPDPADPERLIATPIDFAPALEAGCLHRCDCDSDEEVALYVQLAVRIRDDGESMGLAIAKCRGWAVLTDDKKARRIAAELGVATLGTPEVLKAWNSAVRPDAHELAEVLRAIERFANYRPGPAAVDGSWWLSSLDP